MNDLKRFTLRKEYFGGIVHDAKDCSCDILDHDEYMCLENSMVGSDGKDEYLAWAFVKTAKESTKKKFALLEKKGVIREALSCFVVENIRLVVSPLIIPNACLTAPIRVYDTFTRKCNLLCPACLVSSKPDFKEIRRTLDETKLIMRKFYDAGTMEWRFTGGEPTFCEDFIPAVRFARSLGMGVMVNTNGCWTDALIEQIPDFEIFEIIISLDGDEEANDRRRMAGVYGKIIHLMDALKRYNARCPGKKTNVTLNMTVARDNVHSLDHVVRLAAQYGFNVNFVPLRPYGRTISCLPDTMMTTEEFHVFSRRVQELREDPGIRSSGIRIIHRNMDLYCPDYPDKSNEPYPFNYSDCGALSTGFGLCPDGRVNACSFLMDDEFFVGPNMIDVSVQDAWLHPKMEFFRNAKKLGCTNCQYYMKQCEGKCRAMVLAEGGKIQNGELHGRDRYCHMPLMAKDR